MPDLRDDKTENSTDAARLAPPVNRLQLRVMAPTGVQSVTLPSEGTLVLGRTADVDVRIEDPSISRRHAVLHIGRTVQVEDLGSSNGTRVRDVRVEPGARVDVQSGDVIELGKVLCLLEGRTSGERPRRLWSHGYFEARLEDECARAESSHSPFAVIRVHVDGAVDSAFESELVAGLRPIDVVALYVPGEYEVLRVGTSPAEAAALSVELAQRLRRAAPGKTLRTGVVCHPRDARSPEVLLERAADSVRPGSESQRTAPTGEIVVVDPAMVRLHGLVERVAEGTINVLLLGETGVGKEVFADRIHARSPRAKHPLVKLNCASFTETLIESELFGYEKGAFTGATTAKPGLLETAEGGTVFLDEVGELSLGLQARLLRVLEERAVRRVGSLRARPIDVRIVSATNRDLEADIATGRFRADLFFRFNGIALTIPPLRERVTEIPSLARRFATLASQQYKRPTPEIAPETMALLQRYRWPGNIRELRNVMERAVLLSGGSKITSEHLPVEKMGTVLSVTPTSAVEVPGAMVGLLPDALRAARETVERQRIVDALDRCGGNQTKAAAMLGISRRALVAKLEIYALPRPRKGAG